VHDRCVVEIARGCPWGCRFCQAGYTYRPYREKAPEDAIAEACMALEAGGDEELSFLSLSSSDYKDLPRLIEHFRGRKEFQSLQINFPSMRLDASTLGILNSVYTKKKPTITLAPEAGTDRMLEIIGKKVRLHDIFEISESIFRTGWTNVKLYFMIGLPFETEADLRGILDVVQGISLARKKVDGRMAALNVTISNFIPKPHTPFQWAAQNSVDELKDKQDFLRRGIRNRFVTLKFQPPFASVIEGMLARGGRQSGQLVRRAWENGARFDNWSDAFSAPAWKKAMTELGILPQDCCRERPEDETMPWDRVMPATGRDVLLREWRKAKDHGLHP
jgi:radical SAM superfamily enzyme YgiQ (UPF0313 family)